MAASRADWLPLPSATDTESKIPRRYRGSCQFHLSKTTSRTECCRRVPGSLLKFSEHNVEVITEKSSGDRVLRHPHLGCRKWRL